MTAKACPCGIHPADCEYHRDAYERHPVHPFWALQKYIDADMRAEIDAMVKRIQEGHDRMKVQKP